MIKTYNSNSRSSLNRILWQVLIVGTLSTVGWLSGLTLDLSGRSPTLFFSASASAQDQDEVNRYVRAAKEIEELRQRVYNQIKQSIGNVPSFSCDNPQSLSNLPAGRARELGEGYCRDSENIVRKMGFTNETFNAITRKRQTDPDLEQRVQRALSGG